jgi:hypothetical protein
VASGDFSQACILGQATLLELGDAEVRQSIIEIFGDRIGIVGESLRGFGWRQSWGLHQ